MKLVCLEWDTKGRPFQATHGRRRPSGTWLLVTSDVDWCERDQCLYHHQSGAGGRGIHFSRLIGGRHQLWILPGFAVSYSGKRLSRWQLARLGYNLVDEVPADPTLASDETLTTWCDTCQDWLPDNDPCPHVEAELEARHG